MRNQHEQVADRIDCDRVRRAIATAFAGTAATQTGTVSPATVADHGTPALHAAESEKNVKTSNAMTTIPNTKARQLAVKDTAMVADHGTTVIDAVNLQQNVTASKGDAKPNDKAGQGAVKTATKGASK